MFSGILFTLIAIVIIATLNLKFVKGKLTTESIKNTVVTSLILILVTAACGGYNKEDKYHFKFPQSKISQQGFVEEFSTEEPVKDYKVETFSKKRNDGFCPSDKSYNPKYIAWERKYAQQIGVCARWLAATEWAESKGNHYISGGKINSSGAGAVGLRQIMRGIWVKPGKLCYGMNVLEPEDNIKCGTLISKYCLKWADRQVRGDPSRQTEALFYAAGCYNGGENKAIAYVTKTKHRYGGKDPKETFIYAVIVTSLYHLEFPIWDTKLSKKAKPYTLLSAWQIQDLLKINGNFDGFQHIHEYDFTVKVTGNRDKVVKDIKELIGDFATINISGYQINIDMSTGGGKYVGKFSI